jgi:hypothetical protein
VEEAGAELDYLAKAAMELEEQILITKAAAAAPGAEMGHAVSLDRAAHPQPAALAEHMAAEVAVVAQVTEAPALKDKAVMVLFVLSGPVILAPSPQLM